MKSLRGASRSLWFIILVGFLLRVTVSVFLLGDTVKPRRDYWPFGYEAGRIARSIARGEGFANPLYDKTGPTAWMAPVYPYLLAGVFKVFGVYTKASGVVVLSLDSLFPRSPAGLSISPHEEHLAPRLGCTRLGAGRFFLTPSISQPTAFGKRVLAVSCSQHCSRSLCSLLTGSRSPVTKIAGA